jgi:hypothetical protein
MLGARYTVRVTGQRRESYTDHSLRLCQYRIPFLCVLIVQSGIGLNLEQAAFRKHSCSGCEVPNIDIRSFVARNGTRLWTYVYSTLEKTFLASAELPHDISSPASIFLTRIHTP